MRMVILQTFPDIYLEVLRYTGIFVGSCMIAIYNSQLQGKRIVCVMLKGVACVSPMMERIQRSMTVLNIFVNGKKTPQCYAVFASAEVQLMSF